MVAHILLRIQLGTDPQVCAYLILYPICAYFILFRTFFILFCAYFVVGVISSIKKSLISLKKFNLTGIVWRQRDKAD